MKTAISLWILLVSPLAMAADGPSPRAPVVEDATLYGSPLQVVAPAPVGEDQNVNACVAVGYTVKPDGSLGNFEVLDVWSSKPPMRSNQQRYWTKYGEVAANAVQVAQTKVRMSPPSEVVRTISRVSFGSGAAQNDKCMAHDAHDIYAAADGNRMWFEMKSKELAQLRAGYPKPIDEPRLPASPPRPPTTPPQPPAPRAQAGASSI